MLIFDIDSYCKSCKSQCWSAFLMQEVLFDLSQAHRLNPGFNHPAQHRARGPVIEESNDEKRKLCSWFQSQIWTSIRFSECSPQPWSPQHSHSLTFLTPMRPRRGPGWKQGSTELWAAMCSTGTRETKNPGQLDMADGWIHNRIVLIIDINDNPCILETLIITVVFVHLGSILCYPC